MRPAVCYDVKLFRRLDIGSDAIRQVRYTLHDIIQRKIPEKDACR